MSPTGWNKDSKLFIKMFYMCFTAQNIGRYDTLGEKSVLLLCAKHGTLQWRVNLSSNKLLSFNVNVNKSSAGYFLNYIFGFFPSKFLKKVSEIFCIRTFFILIFLHKLHAYLYCQTVNCSLYEVSYAMFTSAHIYFKIWIFMNVIVKGE